MRGPIVHTKLSDFYNEVARRSDPTGSTEKMAEVKRIISHAFVVLREQDTKVAFDLLARGMDRADKLTAKEKQ